MSKEKSQWQLQQSKTPTKICRVCNTEKIINSFYPRKPYCIDCTKIVLEQQKAYQLKQVNTQKNIECTHKKYIKTCISCNQKQEKEEKKIKAQVAKARKRECIFCKIITTQHYRNGKKGQWLCLSCADLAKMLIKENTYKTNSRIKTLVRTNKNLQNDNYRLRDELKNYKQSVETILNSAKNA